ncbi:MAG: ATP phosphoribosyltransferase regulatory subunit [Lachnospiraceae bacterium]|nr:ATP phosphoribosyltransferase regulatory subunit [Lachnospiraceae bacterium]MDE6999678.1 ATP phosphoribosyltransferase regulatory subunit [Lachnospiraceae bacterium]
MEFAGKRLVHTPEGVRDIYGKEYANKQTVQKLFGEKLHSYGYQDIQTPTFEFFDVFSREIGTTPSKELYKFFDKEGNTLVLRPDFTPSIARCAAKYFPVENIPLRFCYMGNNFINTSDLQGKLKETTQMGAELLGDGSPEADAEMIAMLVEALSNAGLREFQVSVGQIDYFKGLCAHAQLDEETEFALRGFISNRNEFGAQELLLGKNIPEQSIQALLGVNSLFGSCEILDRALEASDNPRSQKAIERLKQVYERLKVYGVDRYISFDLAMVSKYNYYTGVIFNAYTYQAGSAIAKGGRYDNLLEKFGKPAPATGFVVMIDDLVTALTRQKICPEPENKNILLLYTGDFGSAVAKAKSYREQGCFAVLMRQEQSMEQYEKFAADNNFSEVISI